MREECRSRFSNGRLISPEEISLITGMDIEGSEREHEYIRKVLGTGSEDLLVSQFCQYNNLDYHETIAFLCAENHEFGWVEENKKKKEKAKKGATKA